MEASLPRRIEDLFRLLWPLNRSITGPEYRRSLDLLGEIMPTTRLRFPSSSQVLDWTVPLEWKANDAYFVDPTGKRHAELKSNNLHLVGYSTPFKGRIALSELKKHLHTLPKQPTAIPYHTSYYSPYWGFCLSDDEARTLSDGEYEVVVDTELYEGHVEIGEALLPGQSKEEVMFASYLCHPSMANNELSGPLVLTFLYELIAALPERRYSYRFVVAPETIGGVCYLSKRGEELKQRVRAGYVLTCIGDSGKFHYKLSRDGDTLADRAMRLVLRDQGEHEVFPFTPVAGSDERQYCSPGFNLPVGSLMRTPYRLFPEYHTSLDNESLISFDALAGSVQTCFDVVQALEANNCWQSTAPYGEPQLGKRKLYPSLSQAVDLEAETQGMLWLLNLADGKHDLLQVAERSGMPLAVLRAAASRLHEAGLIANIISIA
jgi:aminopeptidase-like protein